MDLYTHATSEPYSFLFVRLDAKTRRDAFWLRFETRLTPQTEEEDKDDGGLLGSKSVDGSTRQPVAQQRPGPSQVPNARAATERRGKRLQSSPGNPVRTPLRPGKGSQHYDMIRQKKFEAVLARRSMTSKVW